MISLIKNELSKIFKKKSLYIILLITIIFIIISNILNVVFTKSNLLADKLNDLDLQFYKEELSRLNINNEEEKYMYYQYKTYIDIANLLKKYEKNSWQGIIINERLESLILNIYLEEDEEVKAQYKSQYDELISKLDSNDWRYFVQEELENIKNQINTLEQDSDELQILKPQKQILEWRLEKDICFGYNNLNTYLTLWQSAKQEVLRFEELQKKKVLDYNEKVSYNENLETLKVCEYAIENKIEEKTAIIGSETIKYSGFNTNAKTELLGTIENYSLFIIIAVVMIAGTIVSEEFNKGTIKLLLVRPYSRTKILLAKFVTCILVLAIFSMVILAVQFIVGGIAYGFNSYFTQTIIYNFNSNSIENINLLQYILLIWVSKLPMFILIMTLSFTCGTLFVNTPIAITIPLLGYMSSAIINQIAYSFEKARFLMYFVTLNWDLSIYLFGRLPNFKGISIVFSITICLIYFVIMMILDYFVFKKRNIKNV